MDKVSVWEFHESIKGYYSGLDCEKVEFAGGEIIVVLEDCMREPVPDAGPLENKHRAKHRYTIRFSGSVRALRIWDCLGYNAPISDWIKQGQITWPCCAAFKLTESAYIDWVNESRSCGEWDEKIPDLVHYWFGMIDDWVIEVVDNIEPTVEVEYL